jgi:hypothetical protein
MTDGAYEQLKSARKERCAGRATAAGRSTGGKSGSCGFGSLGRRPVPGQQFGQARARPTLGQAVDDVGEIGVRIEPVHASRFNNRVNVCGAETAFVAAEKEKILPCDCNLALILPISGKMSSSIIAGIRCTGGGRTAFNVNGERRVSSCMWSWRPAS